MQPANIAARDRLIVALDLPSVAAAEAMIARLGEAVSFYKIGYQLAYAGGLPLVRQLADQGKKVFVDLKLHDIGNTVARGVESVARLGATFLTVHAYPQTMKAAVEARGCMPPAIASPCPIWSRRAPSRRRCLASTGSSVRPKRPPPCARSSATR
jgi:orotidine-5'-phosphate decarboxylase